MTQERSKPPLVAVAGTFGKSMSGFLLQHLLHKAGFSLGEFIESPASRKILPRILTLPDGGRGGWLALEISSPGLTRGMYRGLPFDLCILTNLYPPEAAQLPRNRFLALHRNFFAAQAKGGIQVVNADDPLALEMVDVAGGRAITYALHYPGAMVTVESYKPLPLGSSFVVSIRSELPLANSSPQDISSFPVRFRLPGEVGVYTALAAITAALALGAKKESIARAAGTFTGIQRRLELIPARDILLLDDTAPTSLALSLVFDSLTALRFQRIFPVLGLEKGAREELAKMALELRVQESKHPLAEIFLTTCSDCLPPSGKASQSEEKAFLEAWREGGGRAPVAVFDSLSSALQELALSVKAGDLVLLLGGRGMNEASRLMALYIREESGSPAFPNPAEGAAWHPGLLNPS